MTVSRQEKNRNCLEKSKKKLAQKTTPAQKKQQLIYLKEH
jgi:hypothetical protein